MSDSQHFQVESTRVDQEQRSSWTLHFCRDATSQHDIDGAYVRGYFPLTLTVLLEWFQGQLSSVR